MDQPNHQAVPKTGATPPGSLFADESPMPASVKTPSPRPAKKPWNAFTRIVLPAIVLLGGIAFIAWIAQYLPSAGRNRGGDRSTTAENPIAIEGARLRQGAIGAVFFPADKDYIPEYELGVGGHYDFPFTNSSETPADVGVVETNCSCSGVQVCILSDSQREQLAKLKKGDAASEAFAETLTWHPLDIDKDLKKSHSIPAGASGLLRIAWRGNKSEPELVSLNAKVWTRPSGSVRYPFVTRLDLMVKYVRAALFEETRIDMGSLNPSDECTESFVCWSATSEIDVKPASSDPRLKATVLKLDASECAALEKRLRDESKITTRVRCAFKITVTLYEQRDGHQLDMGYFARPAPITILSQGQPVPVPLPILRAHVRGPVFLSPQEEGGRIDLKNFKVKLGATKKVALFAVEGARLEYVGCEPSWFAPEVKLTKVKTDEGKTQWEMEVAVRPDPDGAGFYLPEDSVLKLECELPAVGNAPAQKRQVRIPVLATAGSH